MQITYADREQFLRTFTSFKASLLLSDEELLRGVAIWATGIKPQYGFEDALARDALFLSNYLGRHRDRSDVADIARGALAYLLKAGESEDPLIPTFGLLDDAFIAGFAVHEIRSRLGDAAQYSPPRLTPLEQRHAEEIFLELLDRRVSHDPSLPAKAMEVVRGLGILTESGILRRLRNNIAFLGTVYLDVSQSREHRDIAKAALEYVVHGDDAIPDELGIAGFIDDNFIAQLAVDLIEPRRDPWLDVLDSLLGAWPFLGSLFLGEEDAQTSISEFLLLNAALTCPSLRGPLGVGTTVIVTPSTGPLPFVLGFISALASIYDASRDDSAPRTFTEGQKVLVDFSSVREFAGYRTFNGQEFFGLRQLRRERGQTLATIAWLPITEIRRLVPAPAEKATRGKLKAILDPSDALIPVLDVLLSLPQSHSYARALSPVLLAAPIAQTRAMAETLKVYDEALCDIIPMAHLSGIDELVHWSPRLGSQNPALIISPDLDYACEFFEQTETPPRLVIIDGSGKNAERQASVARFAAQAVPIVTVSDFGSLESESPVPTKDELVWTWASEDFSTILAPSHVPANEGKLALFERAQRRAFSSSVQERLVAIPGSKDVFQALTEVKSLSDARGEDNALELHDFIASGFRCYLRLLRLIVPLQVPQPAQEAVEADLTRLRSCLKGNCFLTHGERTVMEAAVGGLELMCQKLKSANPKTDELAALLHSNPSAKIVCQDAEAAVPTFRSFLKSDARLISPQQAFDAFGEAEQIVIPAWLGRRTMTKLLMPPAADSVVLILDGIEHTWHAGFRHAIRRTQSGAQRQTTRGELFPGISGWREERTHNRASSAPPEEAAHEAAEFLHNHIRDIAKKRLLTTLGGDAATEHTVEAHFVMFEEGACAFLAKGYRAKTATHLLNGQSSHHDAEIELRAASDLVAGDAVLFLRGSESDVIRVVADTLVPAGTRNLATLWKRALREFATENSLTADQLRERLNAHGCPLGVQAIRNWLTDEEVIGPLAYQRDVSVIAELTQHVELSGKIEACKDAISRLRSAHLRASHVLAEQVLGRTLASLKSSGASPPTGGPADRVVIVRIADIDYEPVKVGTSLANRLLEESEWLD